MLKERLFLYFTPIHMATLSVKTTQILLTRTTHCGITPTIHFVIYYPPSQQHESKNYYLNGKVRVKSWLSYSMLSMGLIQSYFTELVSCVKVRKKHEAI